MAEISPFRGVHYNQRLVDNLAATICPPYDIITPQLQQELHRRSQYNFVRLEFNRELPQDTATNNKYTRSAATLEQWLEQGILETDEMPAIYLHAHHFTYQQREYIRCGITVRVRLEEPDKMGIRPHEGTLIEPKNDRLSLLWTCQANTSPILALFEDRKQQISPLLAAWQKRKPIISLSNTDGESHNVWAITEPEVIDQICSRFSGKPLYIADGHHRYESALTYQREKHTYSPSVSGDEAFDFVMMTLVDFSDPGMLILPPHRLVRGLSKAIMDELMTKLKSFFDIEEWSLNTPDVWQQVDDLSNNEDESGPVIFGLDREHLFMLKLRDFAAAGQMMPYFHCERYKRLEVSIVDHIILEELLGLSGEQKETNIDYSYDRLDAVHKVVDQEYQLAILVRPIKAEVIKAVADDGDKMPKKSTYFYPKLPAGLILHRLV